MNKTKPKKIHKWVLILLIVLCVSSLAFNAFFSLPYYDMNSVMFQNLDNLHLSAKYLSSQNGKGVIIATDLAHDKSELTSLIYELDKLGYGIYIFDFPSQGQSEGNIPFNSNSNKYLAEQFYAAIVSYSQLENMSVSNIHVIGYGTGARAALQTIAMGFLEPESVTLIGTELNLYNKIQYNILNYTIDSETDWVANLKETEYAFPIRIISSQLDNVSSLSDNEELAGLLRSNGNTLITENSVRFTPHYLMMSNVNVIQDTVHFISDIDQLSYQTQSLLHLRPLSLVLAFLSLAAIFYFTGQRLEPYFDQYPIAQAPLPQHFIRKKLVAWLPNFILIGLLPVLLYMLPINYPYNDIFRLTIFSSYGIMMMLLYKFTNFGDNAGKIFFADFNLKNVRGGLFTGLLVFLFMIVISSTGMTSLFSFKSKWLWIIIFTVLCMFPFYVDEKERKIYATTKKQRLSLFLVNYGLLLISPIILSLIGLYNTALMSIIMICNLLFIFATEWILGKINSPFFLNAFIKAFLFQAIVFAQTTMFFN